MLDIRALVIAGGGGGGQDGAAGGGGAGGMLDDDTLQLELGKSYEIKVGLGGAVNNNGQNSYIKEKSTLATVLETIGGGRGGSNPGGGDGGNGGNGGSGGGGEGCGNGYDPGSGGSSTAGQGNNGASGREGNSLGPPNDRDAVGGGGGGAGSAGQQGGDHDGGDGGNGLASDITGVSVTYAAGGAGGGDPDGNNGTGYANPGSGGQQGVAGKDGIVIVRYNPNDVFYTYTGGTITTDGGDIIHTFTEDGELKPVLTGAFFGLFKQWLPRTRA